MPSSSTCSLRRTAPGANVFNSANNEAELSRFMFLGEYSSDAKDRETNTSTLREPD